MANDDPGSNLTEGNERDSAAGDLAGFMERLQAATPPLDEAAMIHIEQTMKRALDADRHALFRPSRLGLAAAALLLGIGAWAYLHRVTAFSPHVAEVPPAEVHDEYRIPVASLPPPVVPREALSHLSGNEALLAQR